MTLDRIFNEYAYGDGPRAGCWWDETCELPTVPNLEGDLDVDVAVIGGALPASVLLCGWPSKGHALLCSRPTILVGGRRVETADFAVLAEASQKTKIWMLFMVGRRASHSDALKSKLSKKSRSLL